MGSGARCVGVRYGGASMRVQIVAGVGSMDLARSAGIGAFEVRLDTAYGGRSD